MRRLILSISILLALPLSLFSAMDSSAATKRTLKRTIDPILVRGEKLESLLGIPIDRIRLYAARGRYLIPIAYQIDEKDKKDRWVLPEGDKATRDKDKGLFDENDVLVFRAKWAGDALDQQHWPSDRVAGSEIAIRDPIDGGRAWVYLFAFDGPHPEPPNDSGRFDPETNRVHGRTYTVGFDRKNPIIWNYFSVPKELGGSGENLCDRLKIRLKSTLLFGKVAIRRNEDDFRSKLVAYKNGPVRSIVKMKSSVKLVAFLRSPSTTFVNIYYSDGWEFPVEIHLPFNPNLILTDIESYGGMDFRGGEENTYFFSSNNPEPVRIDGKMSEREKNMDRGRCDWIVITGPTGTYLTRMIYGESLKELGKDLLYVDDRTRIDPPENVPGQVPMVGFIMRGWDPVKRGTHHLVSYTFRIEDYRPGKERQVLDIHDHPLEVSAGDSDDRGPSGDGGN